MLYLSSSGSATLVTDQAFGDEATSRARAGRLVRPAANRALFFRGDLLHGVAPNGVPPGLAPAGGAAGGAPRVTLMVALWRQLTATARAAGDAPHGGMVAPPPAGSGVGADRWPRALLAEVEEVAAEVTEADAAVDGVSEEVRPLWVRLGNGGRKRKADAEDGAGAEDAEDAEDEEDAEGPLPMARCFQGTTPWKLPKVGS